MKLSVLRQVRKLEGALALSDSSDDWINVTMWNGETGGLFGHINISFSRSRNEQRISPCSDDEEIETMRNHYENDGHRWCGKGEVLPFADYLERFCYLGSEKLAERRKAAIDKLRITSSENINRTDGSSCDQTSGNAISVNGTEALETPQKDAARS